MWAKLTTIEKIALAFGLVFVVVGAYRLVHPTEVIMIHPGPDHPGLPPNQPVHVSKNGSRIYGGLGVRLNRLGESAGPGHPSTQQ